MGWWGVGVELEGITVGWDDMLEEGEEGGGEDFESVFLRFVLRWGC